MVLGADRILNITGGCVNKRKRAAAPRGSEEKKTQAVGQTSDAKELVQSLLDGTTKPKNRYVADLLVQLKEAHTQRNNAVATIVELEKEIAVARERKMTCDGVSNNAIAMLIRWHSDNGGGPAERGNDES